MRLGSEKTSVFIILFMPSSCFVFISLNSRLTRNTRSILISELAFFKIEPTKESMASSKMPADDETTEDNDAEVEVVP